jgi:short-subunit dehydrogenase
LPDNFSERYGPWAVVAGASDGTGASVARLLGDRGINVVLVARRGATLEEVAATIPFETRTLVLT